MEWRSGSDEPDLPVRPMEGRGGPPLRLERRPTRQSPGEPGPVMPVKKSCPAIGPGRPLPGDGHARLPSRDHAGPFPALWFFCPAVPVRAGRPGGSRSPPVSTRAAVTVVETPNSFKNGSPWSISDVFFLLWRTSFLNSKIRYRGMSPQSPAV